jgi:very-short-patch-repair endonuclease
VSRRFDPTPTFPLKGEGVDGEDSSIEHVVPPFAPSLVTDSNNVRSETSASPFKGKVGMCSDSGRSAITPSPFKGKVGMGLRPIVSFARHLRKNSTDVERLLWQHLRGRQLEQFRFRRQRPIGKYVVDFVCLEAKLVIELDGSQHVERLAYDDARTVFLSEQGFRVLRF